MIPAGSVSRAAIAFRRAEFGPTETTIGCQIILHLSQTMVIRIGLSPIHDTFRKLFLSLQPKDYLPLVSLPSILSTDIRPLLAEIPIRPPIHIATIDRSPGHSDRPEEPRSNLSSNTIDIQGCDPIQIDRSNLEWIFDMWAVCGGGSV